MIRFFPAKTYSARLSSTEPAAWERLRQHTELREVLSSVRTSKTFIGRVRPGHFKLITSTIGRGAFCTMEGDFQAADGSGTIRFRIHTAFKALMLFWLAGISGYLIYLAWKHGFHQGWIHAVQVLEIIGFFLLLRFILRRFFYTLVESGLESLRSVLGLVDVVGQPAR